MDDEQRKKRLKTRVRNEYPDLPHDLKIERRSDGYWVIKAQPPSGRQRVAVLLWEESTDRLLGNQRVLERFGSAARLKARQFSF